MDEKSHVALCNTTTATRTEEDISFALSSHYRWFLGAVARYSLSHCPQNRAQLYRSGAQTGIWSVVCTLDHQLVYVWPVFDMCKQDEAKKKEIHFRHLLHSLLAPLSFNCLAVLRSRVSCRRTEWTKDKWLWVLPASGSGGNRLCIFIDYSVLYILGGGIQS